MFEWRYLDAEGEELGSSGGFLDQAAAESWMGESWADLVEQGIQEVALFDLQQGQEAYRMGLSET